MNPGEFDGIISQEYLVRLAKLVKDENENQIEQSIQLLPESHRFICWNIYYFIKRCKSSSKYQFFVRKDYYEREDFDSSELISRRDDFLDFIVKKRFGDSRVIFVTATPGDANAHTSSCTLRKYNGLGLIVSPSKDLIYNDIDNWFQKLSILVVEDIGVTTEHDSLEKAIKLTENNSLF